LYFLLFIGGGGWSQIWVLSPLHICHPMREMAITVSIRRAEI